MLSEQDSSRYTKRSSRNPRRGAECGRKIGVAKSGAGAHCEKGSQWIVSIAPQISPHRKWRSFPRRGRARDTGSRKMREQGCPSIGKHALAIQWQLRRDSRSGREDRTTILAADGKEIDTAANVFVASKTNVFCEGQRPFGHSTHTGAL